MSGKVIAKGPKHGRLFPLQLSIQDRHLVASALFSDSSLNKCQMWHDRLGHPNSRALLSLFKSSLLLDNKVSHKDVSLIVLFVKWQKQDSSISFT